MSAEPTDGVLAREEPVVNLPAFEGPLDLLLYLIRRHEVDICDIPIESVTRQYLDYLRGLEARRIEIAGEFFVMAATLMQIKSRLLVPADARRTEDVGEEDEGEDPRWELVQQLLAYKRFKDAARTLGELAGEAAGRVFREVAGNPIELSEQPLQPVESVQLWNIFNRVVRQFAERSQVGEIERDTVTVADRMEVVLGELARSGRFGLEGFLFSKASGGVLEVVATFLAILELARLGRLAMEQTERFGRIECVAVEPSPTQAEE